MRLYSIAKAVCKVICVRGMPVISGAGAARWRGRQIATGTVNSFGVHLHIRRRVRITGAGGGILREQINRIIRKQRRASCAASELVASAAHLISQASVSSPSAAASVILDVVARLVG